MKNNEKAIKAVNENNQKAIEAGVNNQKAIEAGVNNQKAIEAGMNKEEVLETDMNKEEVLETNVNKEEVLETDVNKEEVHETDVNNQKAIEAGMNKEEGIETDVNKEEGIEAGKQSYGSGKDSGSGKGEIDFDVIDRMFSAMLTANESEERIKNLRPHAEAAVKELLRQLGKPPRFTGTIEYHGFKIRIQRPKSFTWELNTQIDDPQIAYYKAMSRQYDELNMQIKAKRREMKGIAETLALKYPNSESIKSGFSIALMQ